MARREEPGEGACSRFDVSPGGGSLKERSVRSGAVTLGSRGITYGIHLISVIVLARLLTPEDYGLVGMVGAVTAFAGLFQDLGLSSATVQREGLGARQLTALFWINVALGTAITLVVAACAPLVAWFYQRPELVNVTLALSLNFLFGSLSAQQNALLTRQMRFGTMATIHIVGTLVTLVVSVALALAGARYWALVWGGLAGNFWNAAGVWVVARWRPGWPTRGSQIGGMIRFGAQITGFNVVNYFHRNLDNLLIGRVWGADALGLYGRAYSLLMLPISNLRGPLNQVAFPAMSRLQHSPDEFRAYYRRATLLLAMTAMPLTAYLFVAADRLVELVLGRQWLAASGIFRVLSLAAFILPIAGFRGVVFLSLGKGRDYFFLGLFNAVLVSVGFVAGLPWGPTGVAVGYVAALWIVQWPAIVYLTRTTPVNGRDLLEPAMRPAAASIAAGAATWWCLDAGGAEALLPSLSLSLLAFVAFYLLVYGMMPGGRAELARAVALWRYFRSASPKPVVSQP